MPEVVIKCECGTILYVRTKPKTIGYMYKSGFVKESVLCPNCEKKHTVSIAVIYLIK